MNIAATIFFLLLMSMVLGNFVTVMFWKKNLVSNEIKQTQSSDIYYGGVGWAKLSTDEKIFSKDLARIVHDNKKLSLRSIFDGKTTFYFLKVQ